jgi:hypothetical protein
MLKLFNHCSYIKLLHVHVYIFSVAVEVTHDFKECILVDRPLGLLTRHVLEKKCSQMFLQPWGHLVDLVVKFVNEMCTLPIL